LDGERKVRARDVIYIALGIFLIAVLVVRADVGKVLESIKGIRIGLLSLVIGLYFMNLLAKVLRWHSILRGVGAGRTGWKVAPIFLASLAMNNSTPGKVGGEPVRAYLLRTHSGTRYSVGIASIFAEKSLDIITILIFSLIGSVYLIAYMGFDEVAALVISVGLGVVIIVPAIMTIASKRFATALMGLGRRSISILPASGKRITGIIDRAEGSIGRFHDSLGLLLKSGSSMFPVMILDIQIWLNEAARLYLVILALPGSHDVSFLGALGAVSIANILGFIFPIGSGNIIGASSVLELITGDERMSTSASIVAVAASLWLSIPLGLVSLFVLNRTSRSVGKA